MALLPAYGQKEKKEKGNTTSRNGPATLGASPRRSDLGLLGFPPKDLQYRFLSKFKPVYYIRQRDYSKSVNVAPFLINYSGALLRQYPGELRPRQGLLTTQSKNVFASLMF